MKKNTKKLLLISSAALASMYAYNRFVEITSTKKNLLKTEDGEYYNWKLGKIFYTKKGTGSPILLVHDSNSASSSYEWHKIQKKLEKNYTVYTLDLLGCGRSDRPEINYTSYMYVQLITSFVKEVIKDQTDIVASNMSAPFVLMANHMDQSMFNHVVLINPVSLKKLTDSSDMLSKFKKGLINTPLIGTFIYNVLTTPAKIDFLFRKTFHMKPSHISSKTEDAYYEAAHLDGSKGKYLYSSFLGKYMNINIYHNMKKMKNNISIIGSIDMPGNMQTLNDYRKLNSNFETTNIQSTCLYPHLENADKVVAIIKKQLSK